MVYYLSHNHVCLGAKQTDSGAEITRTVLSFGFIFFLIFLEMIPLHIFHLK